MNKYLGQYPVLYISFKDVYGGTMEEVKEKFQNIVIEVLKQHEYLYLHLMLKVINKQIDGWKNQKQLDYWRQKKWLDNDQIQFQNFFKDLQEFKVQMFEVKEVFFHAENSFTINVYLGKELFELFKDKNSIQNNYAKSLLLIAEYLNDFFWKDGKNREESNIVIIIDEFDNGITTALMQEIQQDQSQVKNSKKLTNFIKGKCEDILAIFSKEKPFVKKIIVLGIEQLLILSPSGCYNDILQCPITQQYFEECFGFNEKDIEYLLNILKGQFNNIKPLSNQQIDEVKQNIVEWYNGYNVFEQKYIILALSVSIQSLKLLKQKQIPNPPSYWATSGTNEILFQLTNNLDRRLGEKLLQLCGGNLIQLDYCQYDGICKHMDQKNISEQMISSCFLNTGYLAPASNEFGKYNFRIPNKEIQHQIVSAINSLLVKYATSDQSQQSQTKQISEGEGEVQSNIPKIKKRITKEEQNKKK